MVSLFASNDLTPGTRVKLNLGTGQSSGSGGARKILLVGPKLSTGTATVNTVYKINREEDAILLTGEGSPLHLASLGSMKGWRAGQLYILPTEPSSVGDAVGASAQCFIEGTATKNGSVELVIANNLFTVGFKTGDGYAAIAEDVEAVINANTRLPASGAADTDGYVTITAKLAGLSQNDNIRIRAAVTPGCGITVTIIDGVDYLVDGVDGATTESAGFTTALTSIESDQYYYIGATNNAVLSTLSTHLFNKEDPSVGLRAKGFVACVSDDYEDAKTLALAENYHRVEIVCQENSEVYGPYLLGNAIGLYALGESSDKAYNFASYSEPNLDIPRVNNSADFMTADEVKDAIENGVTIIQSTSTGSYLVRRVTTASKNSTGTINDFRKLDSHITSVADHFADTILIRSANTFKKFKVMDDILLDDGITVDSSQKIPSRTLTPSAYKIWLGAQIGPFVRDGLLVNLADSINSLNVAVDDSVKTKINAELDIYVISLLFQTSIVINEATTG